MNIQFSGRLPWPSPPNALALALSARKAQGLPILDFSSSNPTRLSLDRDGEAVLDALRSPANLVYSPEPQGLAATREALALDLARRHPARAGSLPRAKDLFLCASTSEAYGWLFKLLCEPGDAVLVPKPGYPLFDYLAGLEAVEARAYRLSYAHPAGWRVDLDSLEDGLKKGRAKAVVLINPNNPTGSYIARGEREAILRLAERYGVALIVDEVFLGFEVEGQGEGRAPAGGPSFLGEESVPCFVLDGLSKLAGLPQMKLGWIAASGPTALMDEAKGRLEIIADTYLSASTPAMNALPAWLALCDAFGQALGARLSSNLACLRSSLEYPGSPHRVLRCEGGWTALIEAPRLLGEEEMAIAMLEEEGLSLHPGYYFDMEREACFAASLILEPGIFGACSEAFRAWFERALR